MGCNPHAWLTDLFQLQLYFLPSLLLNWSWLCLVPQRSPPRPCNMCYISCMYSCVLTRNIKIRDGRRLGGNLQREHAECKELDLPSGVHCPLLPGPTNFLPTDTATLKTHIFYLNPKNCNHLQTFKDKRKQNNKWFSSVTLWSFWP